MAGVISRKVKGTVRIESQQTGTYNLSYAPLTLDDIEQFCIEARVYGASPRAVVRVDHTTLGPDSLSVAVPANFEVIPQVPNAGKNARLNRRLAVIATVAVLIASQSLLVLFLFVL